MFKIDIPEDDFSYSIHDHLWIKRNKPGIYRFYDRKGTLLYVGKSSNIHNRIKEHLNVNKPVYNPLFFVKHNFYEVKGFFEPNKTLRTIYEEYLIYTLQPACNRRQIQYESNYESYIHPDYLELYRSLYPNK
ncbi:GIY-YIG nuclease family protein [Risungbinella massiliensis]|uniref:GIY-YIG nuclease family protein n=1 Tax=Risungbinella massiliensis TaxID=1329796 RepID=UPI0005CC7ABA|nr:GIY-YIG nuclease family protein [Risungbinella massiliensis]